MADPSFAPPANQLAGQGLAPPTVAPAISGGLGLALNEAAQLPDGVLYQVLDNGTLVGARRKLNLIAGSNVTLTITDTPASDRVDVTVAATASAQGTELTYNEFTSPVSITATTEGTANTVVTATAHTYDGATVALIEFFAPAVLIGTNRIDFALYLDGASIGLLSDSVNTSNPPWSHARLARRVTPASGSRTYSVRAFVNGGTGSVRAGAGGSGAVVPGFIRVTQV